MRFYNPESLHGEVSHVNLSGKELSPWIRPDASKALTVSLELDICKSAVAAGMGAPGSSSSIPSRGDVAQDTSTKQQLHKEEKKTQQEFSNTQPLYRR